MPARLSADLLTVTLAATPAAARGYIQIAVSSTVLPDATVVAELFGEDFDHPSTAGEGDGSDAGHRKLCKRLDEAATGIANSFSWIKQYEMDLCASHGRSGVMEVRCGYDGIVVVALPDRPDFAYNLAGSYNALAGKVVVEGKLAPNRALDWAELNRGFPSQEILGVIPRAKHGTCGVFDHNVILAGCKKTGAYDPFADAVAGDEEAKNRGAEEACLDFRTDGVPVDTDRNQTKTLAHAQAISTGIGVFGLSFHQSNTDRLRVYAMNGVSPSVETNAGGAYPFSRPLFFDGKLGHRGGIPGLRENVAFLLSDEVAGSDGSLADSGLVSDPKLHQTQALIAAEQPMEPLSQ